MDRNQNRSVSFVPRFASVQRLEEGTPINVQRYVGNNTNQWIPNGYQQSLHISSGLMRNTESSSNNPYSTMSKAPKEGWMGNKSVHSPPPPFSNSVHPFQSEHYNAKQIHEHKKRKSSKVRLLFPGIWYTAVSLTILLLNIYLLVISLKTSTSTKYTDQFQFNGMNSSITIKQPYICSRVSPYTLWTLHSSVGLTMTINTSNCSFNSTPLYFTSLGGTSTHFTVGGYGAIYNAAKDSFIIYILPLTNYSNTYMLNVSQIYQWNVNWFGILE